MKRLVIGVVMVLVLSLSSVLAGCGEEKSEPAYPGSAINGKWTSEFNQAIEFDVKGGKMVRTDQVDSPRERPLKIVSDEGNTVTVVIGNKTQTVTKNSDGTLTLNSDGMTIKLKRK